ncbi:MAG: helix-turn-helix domain-containing protein [Chloroflexi bacterium]|nr:helix-turn-helix domain-containing protein [Chloroflexota bacterium]
MGEEPLLSIGDASQVLGVSEATLRQWTDERKIKAFVTPGRHRRYSRADLKKFMNTQRRTIGIKDLVVELEDTIALHQEVDRNLLNGASWFPKLNEPAKAHLGDLGRRLLNLVVRYVAEPTKSEGTIELVRDVGVSFGETFARLGIPLDDSVSAFLLHRQPLLKATGRMLVKREAFTERVVEAIPLVAHVVDEALVTLVEAHQAYHKKQANLNVLAASRTLQMNPLVQYAFYSLLRYRQ